MSNQLTTNEKPLMTLLKSDVVKERFIETVGPSGGAWITAIINAANLNPKIWDCDPVSVVTAGLNAAVLRLSVDPSTSQAAILPFKNKAVFVPMVRGIKQLALRTGKYRYINDTPIYQGEEIVEDRLSGLVTIEGQMTSKTVIGYLAAFELYTGYRATLYMTVDEIQAHAQRYSPSYNKRGGSFYPGSMWVSDLDKMSRKTVLRLLLLRDGLLDDGSRDILEQVDQETEPTDFELELEDVIEGEIIDEPIEVDADQIMKDLQM